jgi:hypothetical protein
MTGGRAVRRFAPAALLAAVWGTFVAYSWPGFMTWDSVNQLAQARSGHYGNWHPPIMARLWSALDAIVAGPALMLILQTALFALGLYGVLRRYLSARAAALAAAIAFALPPVFAPMSTIWKDSLMAAVLLCAVAGLGAASRPARLAAWVGFTVVAALRHDAPILIVPITAMVVPYAAHWPVWRRRALGAGLGVAACLAGALVNRALTRVDEHPLANMLAMPDLAAVIASADAMTDAEVRELADGVRFAPPRDLQAALRAIDARDADYLSLARGDRRVFDLVTSDAEASAMVHAWTRAIAEHPAAYLSVRFERLLRVLGWRGARTLPYVTPLGENQYLLEYVGLAHGYSPFQLAVARRLSKISRSIVFWPMLYVVLGLGLAAILWRDPLQRGLLVGALGHELALMFIAPGPEYRYSHWLVTCVVIATVVRFVGVFRSRRPAACQLARPVASDHEPGDAGLVG